MKPATPTELQKAVSLLRNHPNGVSLQHMRETFGGDARAELVVETLQASGLAAVVRGLDVMGRPVYRVARDEGDLGAELGAIDGEIERLSRRRRGLESAYAGGGIVQEGLF